MTDVAFGRDGSTEALDTYINEGAATTNYESATTLECTYWSASGRAFTLIKWDLSSLPAGCTITSATLTFTRSTADLAIDTAIYRVLVDWHVAEATWNKASTTPDVSWNTAGALGSGSDHAVAATDTFAITDPTPATVALDVTADVQAFVDGTNNYGWLWMVTGTTANQFYTSCSADNGTAASRPYLEVSYTPAAGGQPTAARHQGIPGAKRTLPALGGRWG